VSTPDATYALGLERSNYCSKPPFESEFFLSPPEPDQEKGLGNKIWNLLRGTKSQNYNEAESSQTEDDEDSNSEETDDYKHLGAQVSLIYTNAPRNFTVIDRVRNHHSQWVIHIFIYTNLPNYYCDAILLRNKLFLWIRVEEILWHWEERDLMKCIFSVQAQALKSTASMLMYALAKLPYSNQYY